KYHLQSTTGKCCVSITCEVEHEPFGKTNKYVGVDTGIKELAILSNGSGHENIRSPKTKSKKLKYEQRQLSKKQKGSRSRNRQKRKLSPIHEQITNIGKNHLYKISTYIIKNNDVISVEDLAVRNSMKNHCLAQAMGDVSLSTYYTKLEYMAKWNDTQCVMID